MSSRHLPVAPLTRAIVEADLESCRQKVEGFSSYCDELVQSLHTYAEQMQKKKGRKKAKEPVLVFPRRPSGRESLNITNLFGDTLMGARTRGGLEPIASEDETASSSTDRTTRGGRLRRTAALKARDGYMHAYQKNSKKVRRPTNFDPQSGTVFAPPAAEVQRTLDYSQLQQDRDRNESARDPEDVFKKPALPLPTADTKRTERPSRSRETRSTTSCRAQNPSPASDQEEAEQVPSRPSRTTRNKTKVNQSVNEPDAANKENALALPINQLMKGLSAEKSGSRTPGNTASKTVNSKIPKKEGDDVLRNNKEEEAVKKKRELMNQKKEEIRKNRETKVKKVAESRAAVEKEKFLQLEREKKEKEEKERQARAELQRKKEEELLKKKLLNQQKAQEAEERRIREEKIRFARLKEQEEEQRRAAEARQRQLEEAERLAALRKAQEKEEEQLRAIEKERREREREKARVARAAPPKDDPDDIGIDDADGEETAPRRPIPKWADTVELNAVLLRQSYYIEGGVPVHAFFETAPATPNLKEIFGTDALPRLRTSSQFWPKTPPHPEPKSAE